MVFTALHTIQTRSSDENSVCPSVPLSIRLFVRLSVKRVICDKMEEIGRSRLLYRTKDHLA